MLSKQWFNRVQYADGNEYVWGILQDAPDEFVIEVLLPARGGVLQRVKRTATLAQAQRFANKFIERADGQEALELAIEKGQFKPVRGGKPWSNSGR